MLDYLRPISLIKPLIVRNMNTKTIKNSVYLYEFQNNRHETLYRISFLFMLIAFGWLLTGCSTTYTKADFNDSPSEIGRVYSGLRYNFASWNARVIPPLENSASLSAVPVSAIELLIDLPFSFVADTLYLPIDLSRDSPEHKEGDGRPAGRQRQTR